MRLRHYVDGVFQDQNDESQTTREHLQRPPTGDRHCQPNWATYFVGDLLAGCAFPGCLSGEEAMIEPVCCTEALHR